LWLDQRKQTYFFFPFAGAFFPFGDDLAAGLALAEVFLAAGFFAAGFLTVEAFAALAAGFLASTFLPFGDTAADLNDLESGSVLRDAEAARAPRERSPQVLEVELSVQQAAVWLLPASSGRKVPCAGVRSSWHDGSADNARRNDSCFCRAYARSRRAFQRDRE